MSAITRWEPVREMMTLREAMDRLFDDAFTRPINMGAVSALPAIDMYQTDEEVVVKASLPGLEKDEVEITLTDNILSLKGSFENKVQKKGTSYHIQEQRYGAFERSIRLPTDVEIDKSKALFENGILTISLPKAEKVRPKTITIKAK